MLAQSKKALSYSELLCKHHSGFILGNKDFYLWQLHESNYIFHANYSDFN